MLSYSGIKWFFSIPPDTRLAASVFANNVSKQAKKEIQRKSTLDFVLNVLTIALGIMHSGSVLQI